MSRRRIEHIAQCTRIRLWRRDKVHAVVTRQTDTCQRQHKGAVRVSYANLSLSRRSQHCRVNSSGGNDARLGLRRSICRADLPAPAYRRGGQAARLECGDCPSWRVPAPHRHGGGHAMLSALPVSPCPSVRCGQRLAAPAPVSHTRRSISAPGSRRAARST